MILDTIAGVYLIECSLRMIKPLEGEGLVTIPWCHDLQVNPINIPIGADSYRYRKRRETALAMREKLEV